MLCREVMNRKVVVCTEGDTVGDCARLMRDRCIGFVPVVDGSGQVSGVVTDRDLALRVVAEAMWEPAYVALEPAPPKGEGIRLAAAEPAALRAG